MSKSKNEDFPHNYFLSLTPAVQDRYINKISLINNIDPYTVRNFNISVDDMPTITFLDIFVYFSFTHSVYTKQQMHAFKSLEGYKFYKAGFVLQMNCSKIGNNFLVISEVKHSQRMNDPPLKPWAIILPDGSIANGHCKCMAGLGEACSHIAALCFALYYSKIDEKSCTDELCQWNEPKTKKSIVPLRIKDINLGKPLKSYKLPNAKNIDPLAGEELIKFLQIVDTFVPDAPILRVIEPFAAARVPKQPLNLPIFLSTLFDKKYENLTLEELRAITVDLTVTKEQSDAAFSHTLNQAQNLDWFKLRQGRITASVFKKACTKKLNDPPLSTIKLICYSTRAPLRTKPILYGKKHESTAMSEYTECITESKKHKNLQIVNSGLAISLKKSQFAASPDGLVSCDCCGVGCVEIKCPYKLMNMEVEEWALLPDTCLEPVPLKQNKYRLKKNHEYYYQIQLQMFCTETDYCDFVIWADHCRLTQRIKYDEEFMHENIKAASAFHQNFIMPELLGKFYTTSNDSTVSVWCYCLKPQNSLEMIKCTNEFCDTIWFHVKCIKKDDSFVEMTWLCEQCFENDMLEKVAAQYD